MRFFYYSIVILYLTISLDISQLRFIIIVTLYYFVTLNITIPYLTTANDFSKLQIYVSQFISHNQQLGLNFLF